MTPRMYQRKERMKIHRSLKLRRMLYLKKRLIKSKIAFSSMLPLRSMTPMQSKQEASSTSRPMRLRRPPLLSLRSEYDNKTINSKVCKSELRFAREWYYIRYQFIAIV